jgi:hypothetical protein
MERPSEGEPSGKDYFVKMQEYLEDFYGNLQEIKAGRKTAQQVTAHMLRGAYAPLGKTRMVQRNIDQFITGRRD